MKILIPEPEYFTPNSIRQMRRVGQVVAKRMTRPELLRSIHKFNALIVRIETKVDKNLIAKARNLKCVVSATTGLNHIDLKILKRRNIPIFSLRSTHSQATAEHTLALLLTAARRIPWANQSMVQSEWKRWRYFGTEISGKTLGLMGIGRIGSRVAKMGKALSLRVIAYDPYLSKNQIRKRGARKVSWKNLLKQSDFLSLHAPLTQETKSALDKKSFQIMKPSAILINTARGEIVNEKALLEALKHERIQTAALDVYPEEPLSAMSPLRGYARSHSNLILTPHLGASTREIITKTSHFAAEAIEKFFKPNKKF